jgi:hypothetical protein
LNRRSKHLFELVHFFSLIISYEVSGLEIGVQYNEMAATNGYSRHGYENSRI